MTKLLFTAALLLSGIVTAMAQGTVKGRVYDKNTDTPAAYATVKVATKDIATLVGGGMTDEDGRFNINNLENGNYTLTITLVGYKTITRDFNISTAAQVSSFNKIYMTEDSKTLGEVTVTGQRATMKLEVDRKTFDVSQMISNAGQAASDVLDNIPSVEVDNEGNVSLRGNTSVEVWINGKSSGLTTDNRAQILQQLPAESIERIEVIDNPSAKFSAEGSAGIINIVLKKNTTLGYYGSVQAGGNTEGGANGSFNINYGSSKIDAFLNTGYRHRAHTGSSMSRQEFYDDPSDHSHGTYQNYDGETKNRGNNLFNRAGLTWHITKKDDLGVNGMLMLGKGKNTSDMPYLYGILGGPQTKTMLRHTVSKDKMNGMNGEINYRHSWSETHFLEFVASAGKWKMDADNEYQDRTTDYTVADVVDAISEAYQYRPMYVNNKKYEIKLDYENRFNDRSKLETGYQAAFSRENTPQEAWYADNWSGEGRVEDQAYFNRFKYNMDVHALYATYSYKFGLFSAMAGLRGEYWKVNTESYNWEQEYAGAAKEKPFKKDYFELFPSLFMSYQITETQQLQLNVSRRLRRPWGGELNSFKDTRDATTVMFGNPELTPEFSNSFALNYLKTWKEHSLLFSAYYRPTTDVMQRVQWRHQSDDVNDENNGKLYQTTRNVAKSVSTGFEVVGKNKLFRVLDLTTTVNAYYYKLNDFDYMIEGQHVHGEGNHNFTWNARMTASLILPYDISVQATGRYRAREVTTQGYRNANYAMDLGARKNFLNKKFTLSVNCRDLLNTRGRKSTTETENFYRYQKNKWMGRMVMATLTWNFGDMKPKRNKRSEGMDDGGGMEMDSQSYSGGSMGE